MAGSTSEKASGWRASPGVLFAILFGINVLNYADRYVLPAVATEIKANLGLTDTQIGLIGTAFLLVYALAAVPAGAMADRSRRAAVVAGGVAIWSVATLLTGLARSFAQLFAVRAFLGIGEASYFPASTSLLADAFPHGSRARLMAWWNFATPLGVFLGFAAGGLVGGRFGWPAAFYLTAVPGLILAYLIHQVHEPVRGASERLSPTAGVAPWLETTRQILGVPTILTSILAQAGSFFVLGGVSFWIPTYMHQRFGLDTGSAGLLSGGIVVVAGGIGTLAGGYLADALLTRGRTGARLFVPAVGYLIGAPAVLFGILTPQLSTFLVFFGLAAALLQAASGPLTALSQDVMVPARRAQAVAVSLLLTHLLGDAFAPTILGALSETLGGLQWAFLIGPPVLVLAALVGFLGARYVGADRKRVLLQASLDERS